MTGTTPFPRPGRRLSGRAGSFAIAAALALGSGPGFAQTPPLEDFAALASPDAKTSEAASRRLALVWKDGYASMVIDLARFFRPARPESAAEAAEEPAGVDEERAAAGAQGRLADPVAPRPRSTEALIRDRLLRFLSSRTGKSFGDDLKAWRRWSWTLPEDPHPEYPAFKGRLYARIDPRMASFFQSEVKPRIRLDEIDWGGVGVNGIPPLDQPKVVPAREAGHMGDRNVVFGIVVNGEARAYPKRILAWHEMALDTLGGVKLAVVYCTLCGTVIPYETVLDGRSFRLGTSGLLYRSNKLMFDAETGSLWSTIEGRPVVGPLAGSSMVLKYRPVVTTYWKEWREAHPDTTVLSLETGHARDYREGAAYRSYFSTDDLMFEVPRQDPRLKRKAEALTFIAGEGAQRTPVAIDAAFLKKNPVHMFEAAARTYVVFSTGAGANRIYRADDLRFVRATASAATAENGDAWKITEDRLEGPEGQVRPREPARRTFWFAWFSQYPETRLIK